MPRNIVGLKKYTLLTYGCQMNVRDSETLSGMLDVMGYQETGITSDADLVIINSCCVRQTTGNRIFGKLGELKQLKRTNPHVLIALCGCMTQQPGIEEKIRKKAPHVDLVFGTHNLYRFPELLDRAASGEKVWEVWEREGEVVENLPARRQPGVRAFVNIMYGCNNFCSYCIVPYVRGRERSRQPEEIVNEVKQLIDLGYQEVMLLGQNVNSYGRGLVPHTNFAKLLKELDTLPGIERIRYMTSHPKDFTEDIIDAVANSRNVCEHFHLPVQAGSDHILKKMNRHYSRDYYLDLIKRVRQKSPECSITTDIIVGFPGESESDFESTLDLVDKARFDAAYTFVYSPRPGTPAAGLEDTISREVKKQHLSQLMNRQNQISLELNQALVGKTVEVLVEGKSKTNPLKLTGRTRTNKIVLFEGAPELIGCLAAVKITQAKTWTLLGSIHPVQDSCYN